MAGASFQVSSFYGGEWSQSYQGRTDRPDYRTALNVCLNWIVTEQGSLTRRPGTVYAGHTRGGAKGRTAKFDFEQSSPITMEFTDGWLRFRAGSTLVFTNDTQAIHSISTANPAVVQTAAANGWVSGNTILPGPGIPLLENRQLVITVIDATHFSIADALTGAGIDGSTLGTIPADTVSVNRVHELQTLYTGGAWSSDTLRTVQAETTSILLNGSVPPQMLSVQTMPAAGVNPVFAINPAILQDGPYLDPPTNGAQVTPNQKNGIITLALGFPAYNSAQSYAAGTFVTLGGTCYKSLADQNAGNSPSTSPTWWAPTAAGAAINDGQGFLGSDIGRLVRLFSEPILWNATTAYNQGTFVSYNPSGEPGAETYWSALITNTGNIPGSDLTNWELVTTQGAAVWTWGRITSLSNAIAGSTGTNIGLMTAGGGPNAAFNGIFNQVAAASAEQNFDGGTVPFGSTFTLSTYVGKNYAGGEAIEHVTVYPSIDFGFGSGVYFWNDNAFPNPVQHQAFAIPTFTLNLRAKQGSPLSSSDGTLLATTGIINNGTDPVTLISSDQTTSWDYVWIEHVVSFQFLSETAGVGFPTTSWIFSSTISQVLLFSPTGTGSSSGVNVEILGPALLYTNTIINWQLGVYSNTTGWPTCGTYHEGRIWLSGAVPNRWDASVSNGIVGNTINFAPTDQYGVVSDSNGISAIMNSDGVNPIYWMQPDLQGIICGTLAGEWLIQAPTTGPITPTNVAVRRVTKIGCADIEPRRTDHTNVFVRRYRKKIMEYFADVFSGKFSAPTISEKSEHIVAPLVRELAYCDAVNPIIWGRCDDGSLFGSSYKRDTLTTAQGPTFAAFHRQSLGSGRVVESICSGPSTDGTIDSLTMVTNDPLTNIRMVEVLTDAFDETSTLQEAWLLDNAINPTSVSSTNSSAGDTAPYGGMTMNGLTYLNGKTVSVFAGGLDCGDFTVANGSIFVPYGDGVSAGSGSGRFTSGFATALPLTEIVIGFTYNSDAQLVRPNNPTEAGSRNGPAFGKTKRSARYAIQCVNSSGLYVGTDFSKLLPIQFKDNAGRAMKALNTFTGIYRDDLTDNYSYDSMLAVRVSRPLPAIIASLGAFPHTQDL